MGKVRTVWLLLKSIVGGIYREDVYAMVVMGGAGLAHAILLPEIGDPEIYVNFTQIVLVYLFITTALRLTAIRDKSERLPHGPVSSATRISTIIGAISILILGFIGLAGFYVTWPISYYYSLKDASPDAVPTQ